MTKRNSKIITIIFICMIFLFGVSTLLKCKGTFSVMVKEKSIDKAEIEEIIQDNFKSRNNWINANGLFQRMLGVTIIKDAGGTDVYKLKNGQIMYGQNERDVSYMIDNVKSLYTFTKQQGMDFLYVQLPFKISNDDMMPAGAKEFANEQADEFIESFHETGVPYIDIRKEAKESGWKWEDFFFNTDHHWRPKAAFWSAGLISKKLSEWYGYDIDESKYNIKNYNIETKKEWFLGSLGKRTGKWYAGVDDFDIITPDFDTEYKFIAISGDGSKTERQGDFDSTLLKHEYLDNKDYFNINTYAGYIGGDYALNSIINCKATNKCKILLVRDSFSCALAPFLSTGVAEITTIDLRYYKEMTLEKYIEKGDFDIVVVAYNPSAFTEKQFSFFDIK